MRGGNTEVTRGAPVKGYLAACSFFLASLCETRKWKCNKWKVMVKGEAGECHKEGGFGRSGVRGQDTQRAFGGYLPRGT